MANVNIKFNGKDFLLSCDDGQEEHLEELANHLGAKFEKLKNDLGNIGENKLLLITSIKIMDEYFETKKKVHTNKQEIKNILIERSNGDRINLKNELSKLKNLSITKKKLSIEDVLKLSNLAENYSVFELSDNYLAKNKMKVSKILNEKFENINTKTLVITGEGDVGSTPEMSINLGEKIKNSVVKIIPKGKHLCSIECSDDVNNTIKDHIQNA